MTTRVLAVAVLMLLAGATTACSQELSRSEAEAIINKSQSYPQTTFGEFQLQLPEQFAGSIFDSLREAGFITYTPFSMGIVPMLSAELTAKGKEHVADGSAHPLDAAELDRQTAGGRATPSRPVNWSKAKVKQFVISCQIVNILQIDPKQAEVRAIIHYEADPFGAIALGELVRQGGPGGAFALGKASASRSEERTFHLVKYDSGWGPK